MEFKIILLLVSRVITETYLGYCLQKFGLTKSFSITFYKFEKPERHLYTLYMWLFSLPMMIAAESVFLFIAGAAIAFTGTAADTRRSVMTKNIHVIGASVGIVIGLVGVWISFNLLWLAIAGGIVIALMWFFQIKNHTYWIERVAEMTIWFGVLLNVIK